MGDHIRRPTSVTAARAGFGGRDRQNPVGEATPPVTAPLTARRAVEENGAAPPSVTHYVRASSPVGGAKGDFSTSFAALTSVEMIREGISGNRCEKVDIFAEGCYTISEKPCHGEDYEA